MDFSRILVRATNWVGDAVMSLPALRAVRSRFPRSEIAVLARPWVADLYAHERLAATVIPYTVRPGVRDWRGKWLAAARLRQNAFDCAILLQNAFEAALIARLAGIPRRIGYARDGRAFLLTDPIPVPRPGHIPRHECYYYLEMLRRAGIIDRLPELTEIRLNGAEQACLAGRRRLAEAGLVGDVVGVSPGAAFGPAKRWMPERFAEAALKVASARGLSVALFGSASERHLCHAVAGTVEAAGVPVRNFAGQTTLAEFIELAAACRVFLTNDSGAMHIAAALGVPTVAVFGPTDSTATGPVAPWARVVRQPVECAPCKFRQCPIDHRCMTRVPAQPVADIALELLK